MRMNGGQDRNDESIDPLMGNYGVGGGGISSAFAGALSDGKRTNGKTEENACGQMGNSNS